MLLKIADQYDEDVDVAVSGMTHLIEPIMIVFLGGAVGFIVISLFLPLIKLMNSLGGIVRKQSQSETADCHGRLTTAHKPRRRHRAKRKNWSSRVHLRPP